MKIIIFALVSSIAVTSDATGLNSTSSWQSKVIGGVQDQRRVSFLASIGREEIGQFCTGFVISSLYIVSAAFCIYLHTFNENYDFVLAIIGKKERQILFMEYHPEYVDGKNAYDIGLIRLKDQLPTNHFVLPYLYIRPTVQQRFSNGHELTLYGYWLKPLSRCELITNVIAYEECSDEPQTTDSHNHVYCVAPAKERSYIEKQDIGAPLFLNHQMIFGIISGGERKGGTYGYVATRITVPEIHEYIDKAINRTLEEVMELKQQQLFYIEVCGNTSGSSDK